METLDGYYKLVNLEACYNGEWKDGHPHGRGMAILANGSLLVGTFSQGFCIWGRGITSFLRMGHVSRGISLEIVSLVTES